VKGSRPWRAVAWRQLGSYRLYRASTSAKSEAGLAAFRARWEADECTVITWEVLPLPPPLVIVDDPWLPEVEAATQVAESSAG
jgi:hypothetical protein